jgi:hypothetical protein
MTPPDRASSSTKAPWAMVEIKMVVRRPIRSARMPPANWARTAPTPSIAMTTPARAMLNPSTWKR